MSLVASTHVFFAVSVSSLCWSWLKAHCATATLDRQHAKSGVKSGCEIGLKRFAHLGWEKAKGQEKGSEFVDWGKPYLKEGGTSKRKVSVRLIFGTHSFNEARRNGHYNDPQIEGKTPVPQIVQEKLRKAFYESPLPSSIFCISLRFSRSTHG